MLEQTLGVSEARGLPDHQLIHSSGEYLQCLLITGVLLQCGAIIHGDLGPMPSSSQSPELGEGLGKKLQGWGITTEET